MAVMDVTSNYGDKKINKIKYDTANMSISAVDSEPTPSGHSWNCRFKHFLDFDSLASQLFPWNLT